MILGVDPEIAGYLVPVLKQFEELSMLEIERVEKGRNYSFIITVGSSDIEKVISIEREIGMPFRAEFLVQKIEFRFVDLKFNDFHLDLKARIISYKNISVSLTEKEAKLLQLLFISHPSKLLRQDVLNKIWQYSDAVETHTLETHISKLKQKFIENNIPDNIIYKDKNFWLDLL